ncbi:MAG: AAA family ATPase, partial [Candidatus Pacebacteria bacterium]|nr:AAA family ATPase [Candidatus Paceibacterota bacterium]
MNKKPLLILISGVPATGKTTFAKKISSALKLPSFSADEIKELISDRISGRENVELFNRVASASYDILYCNLKNILEVGGSCVAEALFIKEYSESKIKGLQDKFSCRVIQIYLKGDEKIISERYDNRHLSGERHGSHVPTLALLLKKYGGYDSLVEKSRLQVGETIEIDTTDFS